MYHGRPFGGLSILWKKTLDVKCTALNANYNNINAICVNINDKNVYVVNVYVPHFCKEKEDEIDAVIANLLALWELSSCDEIIVCGDFNMHVDNNNFKNFLTICNDANLSIYDYVNLSEDSYTHTNVINGACKWLDHFVVSDNLNHSFINCDIEKHVLLSDHLPMILTLRVEKLTCETELGTDKCKYIDWNDKKQVCNYQHALEKFLND